MATQDLIARLESTIQNIPDFPIEGIQFKDITPIFLNPKLYEDVIADLVEFSRGKVDVVCGIESRGYLFGIAIAVALEVPFILIRKKGKLPPPFISEKYDLEYGTAEIEMRTNQIQPNQRVLIHDDLLATGGTTEAAAKLVEKQGAKVKQFSFLIGLKDLHGEDKLKQFDAEVYILTKEEGGRHTPFFKGYKPQFYFRTTDVTGEVELPADKEMVMPGDTITFKVKLLAPIAMDQGLTFAIREGGRTVGAGVVTKITK